MKEGEEEEEEGDEGDGCVYSGSSSGWKEVE